METGPFNVDKWMTAGSPPNATVIVVPVLPRLRAAVGAAVKRRIAGGLHANPRLIFPRKEKTQRPVDGARFETRAFPLPAGAERS